MDELNNLLKKAEYSKDENDYEKSTEYLTDALKITENIKDKAFIYEKIGSNLHVLGREKEARKYLFSALDILKDYADDESKGSMGWNFYLIGSTFYLDDDNRNSLEYSLKALSYLKYLSNEEKYFIFRLIGFNNELLGNYHKAIDFYSKAQKLKKILDEDKALIYFYKGRCYQSLENYNKAINYFDKALGFSCISVEDRVMIYRFLGQCYEEKDELKLAYDYYKRSFEIDSISESDWNFVYNYGHVAYIIKQYDTAIECFEHIKNRIPEEEKSLLEYVLNSLGNCYLWKKNYKSALLELKKAFKINSGLLCYKGPILVSKASAFFGMGNFRKTIKYCLKSLEYELEKGVSEVLYYLLAYSYLSIEDDKKGKLYIEKLRNIDERSAYLRELIEKWEDKLGDDYKKLLGGRF